MDSCLVIDRSHGKGNTDLADGFQALAISSADLIQVNDQVIWELFEFF